MTSLITDPYAVHNAHRTLEVPYTQVGNYINILGLNATSLEEGTIFVLRALQHGRELFSKLAEGFVSWIVIPHRQPERYKVPSLRCAELGGDNALTLRLYDRLADELAFYARNLLDRQTADDTIVSMIAHYFVLRSLEPHNGRIIVTVPQRRVKKPPAAIIH